MITASVPGKGAGTANGQVAFDPLKENPRAALTLANNTVYIEWASSCDVDPYHGWVMAYDSQTLAQKAVLNVNPDGSEAGIWLSDTGPAADAAGNLFVPTGNGTFDAGSGGRDYGDSVLKLDGCIARDRVTTSRRTIRNASAMPTPMSDPADQRFSPTSPDRTGICCSSPRRTRRSTSSTATTWVSITATATRWCRS